MTIPLTIEYYLKKAQKKGYSVSEIKSVLGSSVLWNKVINENKKFNEMLFFYLDFNREQKQGKNNIPQQRYKKSGNRFV